MLTGTLVAINVTKCFLCLISFMVFICIVHLFITAENLYENLPEDVAEFSSDQSLEDKNPEKEDLTSIWKQQFIDALTVLYLALFRLHLYFVLWLMEIQMVE